MTFEAFSAKIVKVAQMRLPGEAAHVEMAPIERVIALKREAERQKTAKKAAVMVLFYPGAKEETHMILILRKTYKGVHSNQVGFPGGKVEPEDTSLEDTALRETEEEVGVPIASVEVVTALTDIYIPPSHYVVQPYLGITRKRPQFIAQEEEVEALIEVPVREFLDPEVLIEQQITTSYATNIQVPAFLLGGHVVWGATAMMLNEVRSLLHQLD
ncbi:NUDIX hydrolase [Altibacter sp. HG106]|uniref:NUDIX hydrolase n=1 Tax=Altibacter sp. HG106 TaxID=3023937 RepID=UPI0023508D45|nr:CoA pyrophosphatase [Altibacter sp. HG106]MDC7993831.1 CoA pyrophosphatase [Altibacter sp. HG106]